MPENKDEKTQREEPVRFEMLPNLVSKLNDVLRESPSLDGLET